MSDRMQLKPKEFTEVVVEAIRKEIGVFEVNEQQQVKCDTQRKPPLSANSFGLVNTEANEIIRNSRKE